MNRLKAHPLFRPQLWSIGIYQGPSPFELTPVAGNPVLSASDITDTAARMVADPFAIYKDGLWHLFFEIDSISTQQGEIGLATSTDGTRWDYQGIVLDEPFHLSYPSIIEWDGQVYMIPESHTAGAVRLYRAAPFPSNWVYQGDLVTGPYKDPALVRHGDRWWLFTCTGQNEEMHIFYADELKGPWRAHVKNPVIAGDRKRARNGGRILETNGRLIRLAQDCKERYGHRVSGFEITRLSPNDYSETPLPENPLLAPDGSGWNAHRMHHLDLHQTDSGQWIGFTDGNAH